MKIGFYNYHKSYNNNRMFTDCSSSIGDDLSYPFVYLAKHAKSKNIILSTIDTEPIGSYKTIFFIEYPTLKNKYFRQLINTSTDLKLIIYESEVIKQDNWNVNNHKYFSRIFTWNDTLVDNKKYLKTNFSCKVPTDLDFDIRKKTKLCTMIAGHKFKDHPLELYTERVNVIRWFERYHPEDFDLFGIGWDRYYYKGIFSRLNRIKMLPSLFYSKYPSYMGSVKSKREIMQKYKFAICYENARDIIGYITEKIFDCFFAGCVPVYWGAPNVSDFIPKNTYIDRNNFNSNEDMYNYLKYIPPKEYLDYLDAIKNFIQSDKIYPFSAECFAETIVNEILRKNHV
ncbi:glycosyltransferase family 10 domain-containing protein [Candidatus Latescibacterota bacterium]